jgi:predicted AlkP superfamily pyrophosphatase or phosphodiesterase
MRRAALLTCLVFVPALAAEPERPRLVVLVVFDQLRGDYPSRWKSLYGPDGFARLQADGAWFSNCHYPYAVTATGPGHASILTGCGPDVHGIIQNGWFDRQAGVVVNCAEHTRYQRVPPLPDKVPPDEVRDDVKEREAKERKPEPAPAPAAKDATPAKPQPKAYGTPERLLAPTVADVLKAATNGKAKVVGLSFKDRSALLPVGAKADVVYWVDNTDGTIVTSTYYRDAVHPWVAKLNRERAIDRWFGKTWDRSRPDVDYCKWAGPDDVFGEGKGHRQGIAFPHPIDGGLKRPGKAYYDALYNSPFGNELLLELVKECVAAEELGRDDVPDLLNVSFASNDPVGHTWGPESQEVLDMTLRTDRIVAELLAFLDETVGKGRYLLCLTSDHGVCPIPEVSVARGTEAKRLPMKSLRDAAEAHLRATYAPLAAPTTKLQFIDNQTNPWFYLNDRLLAKLGVEPAAAARTLAEFIAKYEGVLYTFTRADLNREPDPYDAIGRRFRKAFHPDRSGDVGYVLKPYWLEYDSRYPTGTSHGTPHAYDTHVPLLVFGPNVKPGTRGEEVVPAQCAAIFARALGIEPPAKAEYPVPAGLFEK